MLAVLCLFIIIQAVMLHHLNKVVSLYEAGQSLDIKVLDYLIIGDGCLVSLKEKGYKNEFKKINSKIYKTIH